MKLPTACLTCGQPTACLSSAQPSVGMWIIDVITCLTLVALAMAAWLSFLSQSTAPSPQHAVRPGCGQSPADPSHRRNPQPLLPDDPYGKCRDDGQEDLSLSKAAQCSPKCFCCPGCRCGGAQ